MKAQYYARIGRSIAPILTSMSPASAVHAFSRGRAQTIKALRGEVPRDTYTPGEDLQRQLWDLTFRAPLMNAAGMFKNGECYELAWQQGAGGYLGGTGTWNQRDGKTINTIRHPFVLYQKSHAASNTLGLPNDGDERNAQRASALERHAGMPIGWSVAASDTVPSEERMARLIDGMRLYEKAGVDFLEVNESCPNTDHDRSQDNALANNLSYIKEHFLDRLERDFPVIVKFSTDTSPEQIPELLDLLFTTGYSGVNFGNTSLDYMAMREKIHPGDLALFDFYTATYAGGVSGRPLKESSLELTARASDHLRMGGPSQEFHIIRTGGIESWKDIQESLDAGASLCQWFSGYFEQLAETDQPYRQVFEARR